MMRPVGYDPMIYAGAARHYLNGRPPYSAELASTLATVTDLDGHGRLLDVGCGPGVLTVELCALFDEAIGLDPDADMLAEAARWAAQRGCTNTRWVQSVAEDLPVLDLAPCRLVTFGQSLHWTDRDKVVDTVYDLLEPGGSIALVAPEVAGRPIPPGPGAPPIPHDAIQAIVQRYLGPEKRAGAGRPPVPGDRFEVVLARSRFGPPQIFYAPGRPDIIRDIDSVVDGYLSLSSSAPHLFGNRLSAFVADVRALLREHAPDGRFWDWPGDTAIVIGTKLSS